MADLVSVQIVRRGERHVGICEDWCGHGVVVHEFEGNVRERLLHELMRSFRFFRALREIWVPNGKAEDVSGFLASRGVSCVIDKKNTIEFGAGYMIVRTATDADLEIAKKLLVDEFKAAVWAPEVEQST